MATKKQASGKKERLVILVCSDKALIKALDNQELGNEYILAIINPDLGEKERENFENVLLPKAEQLWIDFSDPKVPGFQLLKWVKKNHRKKIPICGIGKTISPLLIASFTKSCLLAYMHADYLTEAPTQLNMAIDTLTDQNASTYLFLPMAAPELKQQVYEYIAMETLLTHRELETLARFNPDLSRKNMADLLSISYDTLQTHISNIYKKTGTKNESSMYAFAIANGFSQNVPK